MRETTSIASTAAGVPAATVKTAEPAEWARLISRYGFEGASFLLVRPCPPTCPSGSIDAGDAVAAGADPIAA